MDLKADSNFIFKRIIDILGVTMKDKSLYRLNTANGNALIIVT